MTLTKEDLLKLESELCKRTHMSIDELEEGFRNKELSDREVEILLGIWGVHRLFDELTE